jgi:predicted DNA-binding transcriptional regulator YafY
MTMRADRLLSLMFLLQSKGKMTGQDLAQSLNVSERTIYRDIDALNLAGVPIYTQGGRHGGIYLDEQYRISLTGLARQEIQSLFVSGSNAPLRDLGLIHASENALLKLLGSLPLRDRNEAERMRQRVHFDASQWFYHRDVSQWMPSLLEAIFEERKLRLQYLRINSTTSERVIRPYGVVAKAGIWYLVAMTDDEDKNMRTFRVSRFISLQVLDEIFARSESFDLASYWRDSTDHFESSKPRYILHIRVAPMNAGIIRYLHEAYGAQIEKPHEDGWTPLILNLSAMQEARTVVMSMGDKIEIIDPPELRHEVQKWIKHLQDYYDE